ncbi:methyltransferase domain-containing protein [Candidatus Nitronereus thalassa]|uniref:Methyltransferase domain-containing protein n=1 Tax=Candidatus Nitronereus thalassa TaxID=3020898 RepID=A0ABU3K4R4_9BACT|nr:methyltransferase domain-containing protein [Candidatus Nitronereus thalassa]MDT7041404.1 methyltransferase domain-containing protein [Candidatus Nitronereus thalassa]
MSVEARLAEHLAKWGLREFFHEDDYYAWQRKSLPSQVLSRLNDLSVKRQGGTDAEADCQFYDLASSSTILPILYSQRFNYFRAVGATISQYLKPGQTVLDFGCGVGILTTWYASLFPDCIFMGVDRSSQSIAVAQQQSQVFQLHNVSFQSAIIPLDDVPGTYDVIISTQALFQSETDPGLPSRSWHNFEREDDTERQSRYEARTGIGERLDWLLARLSPMGRLLIFEKASHLGRRVLFQRALTSRGLGNEQEPAYLCYTSFGEQLRDGPLYSLTIETSSYPFDESPFVEPLGGIYRCLGNHAELIWSTFTHLGSSEEPIKIQMGVLECQWQICRNASGLMCGRILVPGLFSGVLVGSEGDEKLLQSLMDELSNQEYQETAFEQAVRKIWGLKDSADPNMTPLYENHSACAQNVWQQLAGRVLLHETTHTNTDGQQYHVERGRCAGQLAYLYWANTLDQRQLVVMEEKRGHLLDAYYAESGEAT